MKIQGDSQNDMGYGEISKGAVTVYWGYISGYSPLLLADLVIPGVELGVAKKSILEKHSPSNTLRRMQMKHGRWM